MWSSFLYFAKIQDSFRIDKYFRKFPNQSYLFYTFTRHHINNISSNIITIHKYHCHNGTKTSPRFVSHFCMSWALCCTISREVHARNLFSLFFLICVDWYEIFATTAHYGLLENKKELVTEEGSIGSIKSAALKAATSPLWGDLP